MSKNHLAVFFLPCALLAAPLARAWDYEGHRLVNELALASLPADFPAFVREPANAERVAFLAGEPDRWKNVPDLPMRQSGGSWTDHFLDLEQIPWAGLDMNALPSFRYDFAVQFAAGRAAHADKFPPIDPTKDLDHTREWPGFAPWIITEYFERLRSAFSYLKVFEELGTPEEVANARANAIYAMGLMGHYVGDCAQPLHTTVHHNGWVGDNPNGYSTWQGIHSWIDGGFINKAHLELGELAPRVTPAHLIALNTRADGRDPMFVAVMDYLLGQFKLVEPLYQLEKAGKFSDEMEHAGKYHQDNRPVDPEGRAFIADQLLKGGEMLGSIWLTAWKEAVPDTFLRSQLVRRQAMAGAPAK
jgi:hypothetical protein